MSEYPLDASFEMIGGFWPYGKPDDMFTGTLSARNGTLQLVSAPVYSQFDQGISVALQEEFSNERVTGRQPLQMESIVGFTKERKCTLLRSVVTEADSSTSDFPSRQKVSANVYEGGSAVMGLHLETTQAESIDSASFFYTKIHHVLPTPWSLVLQPDHLTLVSPDKPREVFRFCSVPLQVEVACRVFGRRPLHIKKGEESDRFRN